MGGERRFCSADEQTPPPVEGLDVDDGRCRLALEPHRDLLVDITGIEPTGELTLQELVTMRARLEGYIERKEQVADGRADEQRAVQDNSPATSFRRLISLLLDLVPLVGTTETSEQQTDERRPYSVETVQQLAQVFRAAADARRNEVASANVPPAEIAANGVSSADAGAD